METTTIPSPERRQNKYLPFRREKKEPLISVFFFNYLFRHDVGKTPQEINAHFGDVEIKLIKALETRKNITLVGRMSVLALRGLKLLLLSETTEDAFANIKLERARDFFDSVTSSTFGEVSAKFSSKEITHLHCLLGFLVFKHIRNEKAKTLPMWSPKYMGTRIENPGLLAQEKYIDTNGNPKTREVKRILTDADNKVLHLRAFSLLNTIVKEHGEETLMQHLNDLILLRNDKSSNYLHTAYVSNMAFCLLEMMHELNIADSNDFNPLISALCKNINPHNLPKEGGPLIEFSLLENDPTFILDIRKKNILYRDELTPVKRTPKLGSIPSGERSPGSAASLSKRAREYKALIKEERKLQAPISRGMTAAVGAGGDWRQQAVTNIAANKQRQAEIQGRIRVLETTTVEKAKKEWRTAFARIVPQTPLYAEELRIVQNSFINLLKHFVDDPLLSSKTRTHIEQVVNNNAKDYVFDINDFINDPLIIWVAGLLRTHHMNHEIINTLNSDGETFRILIHLMVHEIAQKAFLESEVDMLYSLPPAFVDEDRRRYGMIGLIFESVASYPRADLYKGIIGESIQRTLTRKAGEVEPLILEQIGHTQIKVPFSGTRGSYELRASLKVRIKYHLGLYNETLKKIKVDNKDVFKILLFVSIYSTAIIGGVKSLSMWVVPNWDRIIAFATQLFVDNETPPNPQEELAQEYPLPDKLNVENLQKVQPKFYARIIQNPSGDKLPFIPQQKFIAVPEGENVDLQYYTKFPTQIQRDLLNPTLELDKPELVYHIQIIGNAISPPHGYNIKAVYAYDDLNAYIHNDGSLYISNPHPVTMIVSFTPQGTQQANARISITEQPVYAPYTPTFDETLFQANREKLGHQEDLIAAYDALANAFRTNSDNTEALSEAIADAAHTLSTWTDNNTAYSLSSQYSDPLADISANQAPEYFCSIAALLTDQFFEPFGLTNYFERGAFPYVVNGTSAYTKLGHVRNRITLPTGQVIVIDNTPFPDQANPDSEIISLDLASPPPPEQLENDLAQFIETEQSELTPEERRVFEVFAAGLFAGSTGILWGILRLHRFRLKEKDERGEVSEQDSQPQTGYTTTPISTHTSNSIPPKNTKLIEPTEVEISALPQTQKAILINLVGFHTLFKKANIEQYVTKLNTYIDAYKSLLSNELVGLYAAMNSEKLPAYNILLQAEAEGITPYLSANQIYYLQLLYGYNNNKYGLNNLIPDQYKQKVVEDAKRIDVAVFEDFESFTKVFQVEGNFTIISPPPHWFDSVTTMLELANNVAIDLSVANLVRGLSRSMNTTVVEPELTLSQREKYLLTAYDIAQYGDSQFRVDIMYQMREFIDNHLQKQGNSLV